MVRQNIRAKREKNTESGRRQNEKKQGDLLEKSWKSLQFQRTNFFFEKKKKN